MDIYMKYVVNGLFSNAMSNLYFRWEIYLTLFVVTLLPVYGNWMYLGLVGVPPPLQQQQPEPGLELEDADVLQADAICGGLIGLTAEQINICMKRPYMINPVASGAHRGIQECQYQFRNERWNCTTNINDESVFGHILETGSKETAFIYAITSAGVVHAITQGCSSGDLADCNCDSSEHGKTTSEGWKWSGCSDNVVYGIEFARKFVDAPENSILYAKYGVAYKERLQMNLHNNEAGRQIVSSLMRIYCRCHGVSGSCELKTCWKMMPPFNEIGDALKKKYNHAVLWRASKNGKNTRTKRNKGVVRKDVNKSDLVHIRKSPNYCKYNLKKGILGTKGRKCNNTSGGSDSCSVLCCGRGYKTQVIKLAEKCHCKFVWCCYVKCRTCEKELEVHYCK